MSPRKRIRRPITLVTVVKLEVLLDSPVSNDRIAAVSALIERH
jgi:hypothetical protein